ncbi:hypothetical protein FQR65_LT19120 [Abscondita terminalis]|nr:hypothetical protein FQR65_LT19120 [Abscondita terminalis]
MQQEEMDRCYQEEQNTQPPAACPIQSPESPPTYDEDYWINRSYWDPSNLDLENEEEEDRRNATASLIPILDSSSGNSFLEQYHELPRIYVDRMIHSGKNSADIDCTYGIHYDVNNDKWMIDQFNCLLQHKQKHESLFIATFLIVFVSIEALTPEQIAKMQNHNVECVQSTNVDTELITKARNGEFSSDENLQKYYFCMFSKIGIINENGDVQVDVVRSLIPPEVTAELAEKVISDCKDKKGTDKY